jgi:hypothetical protein
MLVPGVFYLYFFCSVVKKSSAADQLHLLVLCKKKNKNWKTNSYCRSIGPCNRNSIKISMTQFFPIYILFFRIYLISWINWNFVLKLQYFSMHWTCSRSIQDTGQELRHVHVPFWRLNRKYDDLIWKSGSVVWADALYDDISLFFL